MLCTVAFGEEFSVIVAIMLNTVFQMLNGFFIKPRNDFIKAISHVSHFRLFLMSKLIIIYGRGRCDDLGGSFVLDKFEIEDDDLWPYFGWLVGMTLLWQLLGHMILLWKMNPKIINVSKYFGKEK